MIIREQQDHISSDLMATFEHSLHESFWRITLLFKFDTALATEVRLIFSWNDALFKYWADAIRKLSQGPARTLAPAVRAVNSLAALLYFSRKYYVSNASWTDGLLLKREEGQRINIRPEAYRERA